MADFFFKAIGVDRLDINNVFAGIAELSRPSQRPSRPEGPSTSAQRRESSSTANMGNGGFAGTNAHPPAESSSMNDPQISPPATSSLSDNASEFDASPQNDMACDNCSAKFTLFKTKKICRGCKVNFCGACMTGAYSKKFCVRCKVLFRNPPIRDDLMELRVKDLQRFIISKKVSTKSCVEKKDLVELIIRIHCNEREGSSSISLPEEASSAQRSEAAGGPRESSKNFPKNYVQSTHREEWISRHNLHSDEDVVVDDFVVVSPESASLNEAPSTTTSSSAESPVQEPHDSSQEEPPSSSNSSNTHTEDDEEAPQRNEDRSPDEPPTNPSSSPPPPPQASSNRLSAGPSLGAPTSSPKRFSHQELVKISEIETEEDLYELSVKQMKEILALNRVMFKGVIEKEELLKIVQRLWLQDKRNNEEKDNVDDEELCKICMDAKVDCVMLECGHMCTCISCGKVMSECPICRRYVVRVVKIFKA